MASVLQASELKVPQSRCLMRPVRLGFLGVGWIGRKRLASVSQLPGVEIVGLADSNVSALQALAAEYPRAQCSDSLDRLLALELDGVVIATPSAMHAEQTIAAFERGLHVFCQKPLAMNAGQTRGVVEAARKADRLLDVDYCYRHVRGMNLLRERIRAGALGEVFSIDATFHNAYGPDKPWCYDPQLAGGGCVLDLGVHLVDLVMWLQDFPRITDVSSRLYSGGRLLQSSESTLEDFAVAQLQLASGAVVRLACSWNVHAGRDALIDTTLYGSRGGAAWRNVNGSFYDFTLAQFSRTSSNVLSEPPDDWGARAVCEWAQRIAQGGSFDPAAEGFVTSAKIIDAIYGR